jgi:hypothetical protein
MESSRPMDREAERPRAREQSRSQLARLVSMFHAPGRTFAEIARTPTLAGVLIATALAGALAATAVSRAADLDAMAQYTYRQQQADLPGTFARNRSDADEARALDAVRTGLRLTRNFAPVLGGISAVAAPLVTGAALLLLFGVLGSPGSYRAILSTVAHAWWPAAATSGLLNTVVVWMSHPMVPERAAVPVRTSLAAILPDLEGTPAALAGRVDLFLGWEVLFLGTGLAITLGVSRRLSFGAAFGLWAAATAVVVGFMLVSNIVGVQIGAAPA